jgi:hypothetical protein
MIKKVFLIIVGILMSVEIFGGEPLYSPVILDKVLISSKGKVITVNKLQEKQTLKAAGDAVSWLRLKKPDDSYNPLDPDAGWSLEKPAYYSNDYGFGMGRWYVGIDVKKIYTWNIYSPILDENQNPTEETELIFWCEYLFEPDPKKGGPYWHFTSSLGDSDYIFDYVVWWGWVYIASDFPKELPWGTWKITVDYTKGTAPQERILDETFERKEFIGNRRAEPIYKKIPWCGHFDPYSKGWGTIKYKLPDTFSVGRKPLLTVKIFNPLNSNLNPLDTKNRVRILVGKKNLEEIDSEEREVGENEEPWSGIVEDKDYVGLIGVSSWDYVKHYGTDITDGWYKCLIEAKDPWDDYPKGSEEYKKSINSQLRWVVFWIY